MSDFWGPVGRSTNPFFETDKILIKFFSSCPVCESSMRFNPYTNKNNRFG
jgi:hypothetical protein